MPRSRRATLMVLAVIALVGAGCGGGSTSSSTAQKGGGRLVSYHRSGGLAYSDLTLTVDSDGHAVAISKGPTGSNRRSLTLPPTEVAKLRKTLGAAPLAKLPKRMNLGCADCYRYQLEYGGERYGTDEASLPSSLKPVVAALDPIAAKAIPQSIAPDLAG